jgi:hypothetical protein
MDELKTVQIPAALFNDILSFIGYLEFSGHQFPSMYDIHGMFSGLSKKQHSINLRKSYSGIIHANDDDKRRAARDVYLKLKNS